MGHAIERIFMPVMKMQYPEIVDVAMPAEGIFQNLMIVSIRKSLSGARAKDHERDLVAGAGDVHQGRGGGGSRRERAGFPRSGLESAVRDRSRARHSVCAWDRWIRWTTPRAGRISARRWASTRRANGPKKVSPDDGRTRLKWIATTKKRVDAIWQQLEIGQSSRAKSESSESAYFAAKARFTRILQRFSAAPTCTFTCTFRLPVLRPAFYQKHTAATRLVDTQRRGCNKRIKGSVPCVVSTRGLRNRNDPHRVAGDTSNRRAKGYSRDRS